MIPLVKTWLKPGGKLVLTHLSWLPRKDPIAQASEQLILRYNPHWSDADFPGSRTIQHAWSTTPQCWHKGSETRDVQRFDKTTT